MKKNLAIMVILAATLSLAACGSNSTSSSSATQSVTQSSSEAEETSPNTASESLEEEKGFASADEVTLDELVKRTSPAEILKTRSIFKVTATYENTDETLLEGASVQQTYAKENGYYQVNDITTYSDGYVNNVYCSDDPSDGKYYISYPDGSESADLEEGEVQDMVNYSLLGLLTEDSLDEVKEEDGLYIATITCSDDTRVIVTIDPSNGRVLRAVSTYANTQGSGDTVCSYEFDYSDSLTIDKSAKTGSGETTSAQSNDTVSTDKKITYNTTDLNGEAVTDQQMRDAKLVLVNYWEPWCKPCVGEMPDLEKLYENYKDKGLLILGVFADESTQEDAEAIVESKGITYPILHCDDQLAAFTKDYVPVTYVTDGEGNLLKDEPISGSQDYETWEKLVKEYLS